MNIINLLEIFQWKFNHLYKRATTGPRNIKRRAILDGGKRKQFRGK
jgi:hypothetical protein